MSPSERFAGAHDNAPRENRPPPLRSLSVLRRIRMTTQEPWIGSALVTCIHICEPQRMRIPKQNYDDIERIIEFDFVRATEAAALNALPWLGRGEKEKADAAACDAIRGMFDLMNICGEVVIGEGIKDDAPGIFKG